MGNVYRGIKLADSVKLYMKDGNYYKKVKDGLDNLVDLLKENGHELLSEFKNNRNKILIDFNCGHKPHEIEPSSYKRGWGCPKCSGKCTEQAKDDLIRLIEENGHLLLSDYINAYTKVKIDFRCGHPPHKITPANYKNGNSCPLCYGNLPERVKEHLILLVESNEHELLSDYTKAHNKILIDFKCGHEPHWTIANNYKNGNGCPACKESKGEKRVRNWLKKKKLIFETQKEYNGLIGINGGKLSYDFYIPELNILIEYQGQFHDGSGGEYARANLGYQQEHDRRKREYAEIHNINLLEIWYWDFNNVEEILKSKLIIHNIDISSS